MEKADQGGKGTVVLATVKGDVHDIGKNLVDIILTNNGYEVVNLGIKVGINEMIAAAEEHKADAIGMSGLLVKSTLIMRENLAELNDRVALGHPGPPGRGRADPHLRRARPARGLRAAGSSTGATPSRACGPWTAWWSSSAAARTTPTSGARSPRSNVPRRSRLDDQRRRRRWRGSPRAPTWRRTTRCSRRPSWAAGWPVGIPLDDIAEYLNLTALFRNQWGFRPEDGENDAEFKDRVKGTLRDAAGQGQGGRPPRASRWPTATSPPTQRATTWSSGRTSRGRRSGCASPSRASARSPGCASPTSSARPTRARRTSPPSCCAPSARRASEETARLFAENEYQNYLFLHGLGVEMAEATAEYWHRRIREELGFADEDGPTLTGLFRQHYRGGRYSWGYPACPDLTDNAKVVELLGGDRIGVTVSEGFQLNPEQTTDAIICHHPEAKYFVVREDGPGPARGLVPGRPCLLVLCGLLARPGARRPRRWRARPRSPRSSSPTSGPATPSRPRGRSTPPGSHRAPPTRRRLDRAGHPGQDDLDLRARLERHRRSQRGAGPAGPFPAPRWARSLLAGGAALARLGRDRELRPVAGVPGAHRTTYFASTTQAGVGQAITLRAGVYVTLLSFFSAASGNAEPITQADAVRIARAQQAAMVSATRWDGCAGAHQPAQGSLPRLHRRSSARRRVLGVAVVTPALVRRRRQKLLGLDATAAEAGRAQRATDAVAASRAW